MNVPTNPAGHPGDRPANPNCWWRESTRLRVQAETKPDLHWSRWLLEPIRTWRAWRWWRVVPESERHEHNAGVTAAARHEKETSGLDASQQAAAVAVEDRVVITAGAGSGKTRTMVARAEWAVTADGREAGADRVRDLHAGSGAGDPGTDAGA